MEEIDCPLNQSIDRKELNMASTPYKYDVLPKDSIRILSLLPGDNSAPLQCELHRADVPRVISPEGASGPAFEALSYVWGDGTLCQRLFCNTSAIKITQSLFDALIHLRHPKATRKLWVDAVCIDQNSNDEKIVQLPYMKDIYQHANQVVIWLGLADDSTGRALDLIRRAAKCLRQESGQSMPQWESRFKEPFSDEKNRQRGFPPIEDLKSWLPVAALFARSWFSRCWTYQEAVLATKATIQIGAHLLDWADLCVACTFFYHKSYGWFQDRASKTFLLCQASKVGSGMQEWTPMPLLYLLVATLENQVTLPKDRIFCLLSLTYECTQNYFSVKGSLDSFKYNMSMRELYTDVTRLLLIPEGNTSSLGILNMVKHYPLEEGEQEKRNKEDGGLIPSWVKRWHDPTPPVQRMSPIIYSSEFRAGGPKYHLPEWNHQTRYEISLHGFIFTTISNTVNILRVPPESRFRPWDMVLEIRGIRKKRHAPYLTGESIDEAFAQTLTAAMSTKGAHAIDFQQFCVYLYELTVGFLLVKGQIHEIERLRIEWEAEYQRLKSLVRAHIEPRTFMKDLTTACKGRKLFSTLSGHIGIGDGTLESGDLVCVFLGGITPFIIRPVDQKYKFVGECYVHGIMHGEAFEEGLQRRQLIALI